MASSQDLGSQLSCLNTDPEQQTKKVKSEGAVDAQRTQPYHHRSQ